MCSSKFAAFFVLGILSFLSLASVSPSSQEARSADIKEPRIDVGNALPRIGMACGCFFTIEDASRSGENVNSMEAAYVPERILGQSPQQVMDLMTVMVPNFTYAVDKVDSRIIHIKDKRLSGIEHYGLDQTIGPFEFQGDVVGLVNAIGKLGVPIIHPTQVGIGEPVDRRSQIRVKGNSMQVRAALSNFIPLEQKKSKVLWIARTSLDNRPVTTQVYFVW
jgi:hypothetical protein